MKTSLKVAFILFGGLLILQTILLAHLRPPTPLSPWLIYIGRSPEGRAYIYRISLNGEQRVQLTDVNSINSTPSLSPDGSQLSYIIRDTVNHRGLWVMDMTTRATQRFDTNGMALDVAWSPQGDWLAYQTWANGYFVYMMRPDGSDNHTILPQGQESETPLWSPDGGSLVFYACYLGCNIHRLQFDDDQTIKHISEDFYVVFEDEDYEWSPDGQAIYVVMSREIWRVPIATGQGELVAAGQNPSIAPDGKWIVYEDRREENVFVMKTRGEGSGQPIELAEGWNPVWSPDGDWIVYVAEEDGVAALYLMRPDGTQRHHLVEVRERFPDPQWSPPIERGWHWWVLVLMGGLSALGPLTPLSPISWVALRVY